MNANSIAKGSPTGVWDHNYVRTVHQHGNQALGGEAQTEGLKLNAQPPCDLYEMRSSTCSMLVVYKLPFVTRPFNFSK